MGVILHLVYSLPRKDKTNDNVTVSGNTTVFDRIIHKFTQRN